MVAITKLITSALSYLFLWPTQPQPRQARVAIIGGGPSGLGILQGLLDVPMEYKALWSVDLFEGREDIGGTWLPDTNYTSPNIEPATALYPSLHLNDPCPLSTIPGYPFPPGTPLHAHHWQVLAYQKSLVESKGLGKHILVNHRVLHVDRVAGEWEVKVAVGGSHDEIRRYDHVVVATGRQQVPLYPSGMFGEDQWLAAGRGRRVKTHAKWYRTPGFTKGKMVILVGYGPSASSILGDIAPYANEVIICGKPRFHLVTDRLTPNARNVPRLLGFNAKSVVLADGTEIETPNDAILIYCTGYSMSFPFLTSIMDLAGPDERNTQPSATLTFNRKYVRPLYNSLLAVDERWPLNALAFATVQTGWTGGMAYVNGLLLAHSIIDPRILPDKEEALDQVLRNELKMEAQGKSFFNGGHFFSPYEDYFAWPDKTLSLIRSRSQVLLPKTIPEGYFLDNARLEADCSVAAGFDAWEAAVSISREFAENFTKDAVTEEDFSRATGKMREWWIDRMREEGISVGPEYYNCQRVGDGGFSGFKRVELDEIERFGK